MRRIKRGFSLIELLVVISISGLIIAIASTSYTTAQRQARDARRMEDMKTVQGAMEQFFILNNRYPSLSDGNLSQAFSATVPEDPKPAGSTYDYTHTTSDGYCICATLENATGNSISPSSTTCNWDGTGSYYCVQNQQ